MSGILNIGYNKKRLGRIDFAYRLKRRTLEVWNAINKFAPKNSGKIECLDIGTADGLMLSRLNSIFNFNKAIGIDMSHELIKANKDEKIKLEVGDAENLRFENDSFDIVIACAVIEHINDPNIMLKECHRVLRKNGIIIITTPNPFNDKIAEFVGYFKKGEHNLSFNLKELGEILKGNNFNVVLSNRFMLFPFFKIPFEKHVENLAFLLKLDWLMSNQIIVGIKR